MKNNFLKRHLLPNESLFPGRKVKWLLTTLAASALQLSAAEAYVQEAKISLDLSNVTLAEAFRAVEAHSPFVFFYNHANVDMEQTVSLHVTEGTIEEVMRQLLASQHYRIEENKILLLDDGAAPQQEERMITGSVTDARGPIIGANVVEKGTTNGTISDINGRFTLRVAPGATL